MTLYYPAVIEKTEKGFKGSFVDLEHCTAEGATMEEMLEELRYAGVTWIQVEQEDGGFPPEQTHIDDISVGENQTVSMIALIMPREGWDE